MPKSAYPSGVDLEARLRSASISDEIIEVLKDEDADVFDNAVASAIAEWESVTGWSPYLAGPSQTLVVAAPTTMQSGRVVPSGRLALSPPVFAMTAVSINGRTLRAGIDFRPGPGSGGRFAPGSAGNPYCWFDLTTANALAFPTFPTSQYVGPLGTGPCPPQFSITGRFGKVDQIPDDVWDCLVKKAQADIAGEVSFAITQGTTERKVGDVTTKFSGTGSDGPLDWPMQLWAAKFARVSNREKRVVF